MSETPELSATAIKTAEKHDKDTEKQLAKFDKEMSGKPIAELQDIYQALGATITRKAPKIAELNWKLGNVQSEKILTTIIGVDVDNDPRIASKEVPVLVKGKITTKTVYWNKTGYKHIKSDFLKRELESMSEEQKKTVTDFTDYIAEYGLVESEFKQAQKDMEASVIKVADFAAIATKYAEATEKYNTLKDASGFSDEKIRDAEEIAKLRFEKEYQAVVEQLKAVQGHVKMNSAKMSMLQAVLARKYAEQAAEKLEVKTGQKQAVKN